MESAIKFFGKRVKEIRKKKGYTQEELAEILDVDYQTISRIENGYYFTSFENLEKMANAFDIPIRDLFDFQTGTKEQIQNKIISVVKELPIEKLQKLSRLINEIL